MFTEFDPINESNDRLDISIVSADKYLSSKSKLDAFFNTHCTIEAKSDGVKVTCLKVADNGNLDDYIFAYKGHILCSAEFEYQPDTKAKFESIGSSQFKLLLKHFEKLSKNNIPVNTELQLEFLMRKSTLSSNYTHPHGIVLIGYSKSTYEVRFGKLKTKNTGMQTQNREKYAKELRLNVPLKIFDGFMNSENNFQKGIQSKELKKIFPQYRNSLNWNDYEILYPQIKSMLLQIPSVFGGKEEGVVIKFSSGLILKIQQDYQLDQEARKRIKQKYQEDNPDSETQYWENVKAAALEISSSIYPGFRKLPDLMEELSATLKRYPLKFTHSKKTPAQIKDDIQVNAKNLVIKRMRGNAGCLILGKFRVLTNGHAKLIRRALKNYDKVVVCLVTSKDTETTKKLRRQMIEKTFGNRIELVEASNGNLIRILDNLDFNINVVYSGSDRVADYTKQLSRTLGVSVKEMPRDETSISATKVIEKITDQIYFEKNTPKEIHGLYKDLVKVYSGIQI